MSVYARHVLPRLINLAMQTKAARVERAKLLPRASGTVLEVGIGSGLNIPFYPATIQALHGVDPSPELLRMARRRAAHAPFPVELVEGSAETLRADDETYDTVVTTWTVCSIPDPEAALRETRRLLKPGGRLLFVEHGSAPDAGVRVWQDRLTPLWRRLAGGCHLNRKMDDLIAGAGFVIADLETGYVPGPRPLAYLYRGTARRAL